MSEDLKNDVIANTARVEDIFGIDNRAARGYGLVHTSTSKSTTNETRDVSATQSSLTSDMLDINKNKTVPSDKKSDKKGTIACPDCNRSGLKSLAAHRRWCKKTQSQTQE